MENFSTFVCYNMKVTMKKVEKYLTQELEVFGINFAQALILWSLLEKDGLTLSEIGLRAQIENSSLTTMVDKLEKEQLVERRLDPQDRRMIRLFLTDKGRNLGEQVMSSAAQFNQRLRGCLSPAEGDFLTGLSRIANELS
ncbi:MAG: MarR family winged helix-turn-helix transcriptional regulator [Solirubrobacterales bacterium]